MKNLKKYYNFLILFLLLVPLSLFDTSNRNSSDSFVSQNKTWYEKNNLPLSYVETGGLGKVWEKEWVNFSSYSAEGFVVQEYVNIFGQENGNRINNVVVNNSTLSISSYEDDLGVVWDNSIQNGVAFCIGGEFIYLLSYVADNHAIPRLTAVLSKISKNGSTIWNEKFDYDVSGLTRNSIYYNNGFIYTVWKDDEYGSNHHTIVSKISSNGTLVWQSSLISIRDPSISVDQNNLYICGWRKGYYSRTLFLYRLYLNGTIDWEKTYSEDSYYDKKIGGILVTQQAIFVLEGSWTANLTRFSKDNGSMIWTKNMFSDCDLGALWANNDSLFVATEGLISKVDFQGNALWNSSVSNENQYPINSIWATDEDVYSFGISGSQYSLIRFNITTGEQTLIKKWGTDSRNSRCIRGDYSNLYTLQSSSLIKWVYDGTPPILNDIPNVTIEQSNGSFLLVWSVEEENPKNYSISKDGLVVKSDDLTFGQDITIQIDKSILGAYNYSVVVTDTSGYIGQSSCIVTVQDTVLPTLYSIYSNDTNVITWVAEDRNPDSYLIYKNGEQIFYGNWISEGKISITFLPEEKSSLNYTIVVQDTSGNRERNTVTIPPLGGEESDSSSSSWGIWFAILIISFAGGILVVILYKKFS